LPIREVSARNSGFSLLEIILTLFLLGLISSLIIPRFVSSKSSITVRTSASEIAELFFLSQQQAQSLGITTNVSINYNDDGASVQSLVFSLKDSHSSRIEDTTITIPQTAQTSITQAVTHIEFYPNKSWGLFIGAGQLGNAALVLTLSDNGSLYELYFYPNSTSIEFIKPN
jgi:prepilin-type N-terminal cleavage/methylation domain-containing protein